MATFDQLNPHLLRSVCIRPGSVQEIVVKSSASAGFLCSVEVHGDAARAEIVSPPATAPAVDHAKVAIGAACDQVLRIEGVADGVADLVLRHARPWMGSSDALSEEIHIEVKVVSEDRQQAWEDQVQVPPVSDVEVRQALDWLDGRKPYGSKKCDAIRQLLTVVAKDVAVHQHAGHVYVLEDWKTQAFAQALPRVAFPLASPMNVRLAVERFVSARLGR